MPTFPEDEPEVDYRALLARIALIEKQMAATFVEKDEDEPKLNIRAVLARLKLLEDKVAAHHAEIGDLRNCVNILSQHVSTSIRKLSKHIVTLGKRTKELLGRQPADKARHLH